MNKMSRRITYQEVKESIELEGYKLLSKEEEYVNTNTYITVQCPHNHEPYEVKFHKWKCNRRCPKCRRVKPLTQEEARLRFAEYGLKMKEKYINVKTPIRVECEYGHVFLRRIGAKDGCPHCYGNARLTQEQIKARIEKYAGYEVKDCSNYSRRSKITIQCPKGHLFNMRIDSFQGCCPFCSESKGEAIIRTWLESNQVEYTTQHIFKDCFYKGVLRFDFYLPRHNTCIEFDGEQHFKPTDFTSKKTQEEVNKQFNIIQKRDKIKNTYCKDNNITLVRIPYYEINNIDNILKELF